MNLKRILVLMAIVSFVITAFGWQNSADHKVLFEKAKYTMETKGDLSGAIKLFEEIIQKYSEEREYAAKSQLYIGLCYEKLGVKQTRLAQSAFQKVVDNYPEQADAVKMANKKLSVLAKTQVVERGDGGLKVRQLLSGPELLYDGWLGGVSPDGRYVSIVDWETGDLAIRDLLTGKKMRLTDQKNEKGYAIYSTWSPDGKWIVYDWWNGNSFVDLRIISIEEKEPHTVYKNEEIEYAWPLDWFPDGEHILIAVSKEGLENQRAVLSLGDVTTQIIPLESEGTHCISPDGRYISYGRSQEENAAENDIFLYSIEEEKEIPLIEHPANEEILGWSPDGRWILFQSSRLGSKDAWILPVSNGKAQGNPRLVKRGIGEISSMGFSRDGSFYYMSSKQMEDIYKATIDPKTGEIRNPPKKMDLPYEGNNGFPVYSPDGKKLAYLRGSIGGHYGSTLHIRSLDSGQEQAFSLESRAFYPRWSPDRRTILLSGITKSRLTGIYKIDVQTGEVKSVLLPKPSRKEEYRFNEWAPDGKSFFYIQGQKGTSHDLLCRYDLKTEKTREIHQTSYGYAEISLSPDGRWLAFIGREPERELKIVPAVGGEPRVLCRFSQKGGAPIPLAWTPDSQYILFFKQKETEVLGKELCRVSVAGGDLQEMGLSMVSPGHPRVHPNGQEIVFSSLGFSIPYPEFWVMENFLPAVKSSQNK